MVARPKSIRPLMVLALCSVLLAACVRFGFGEAPADGATGERSTPPADVGPLGDGATLDGLQTHDGALDLPPNADGPASAETHASETSVDTRPADTSVDGGAPDASVDTLLADTSVDTRPADTSVDSLTPDMTRDGLLPTDAWTFDADPTLRWTIIDPQLTSRLNGVWGATPTDIWVCGFDGALVRVLSGAPDDTHSGQTAENFYAIHGVAEDAAYVVGTNGTIWRWNGNDWSAENSPATVLVQDVWATGRNTAWATAGEDVLFRAPSGQWGVAHQAPGEELRSVWAASDSNVWVASYQSKVHHFDGNSWQVVFTAPSLENFTIIRGRGAAGVWLGGHRADIYEWTGSTFESRGLGTAFFHWTLWLPPAGDVWTAFGFGEVHRYDGATWHLEADFPSASTSIYGLWGFGDSVVWAAGAGGLVSVLEP